MDNHSLCHGLGRRIVAVVAIGIGVTLVDLTQIGLIKDYAWGTGIDQPGHTMCLASGQHVLRTLHIDVVEILPFSPDSRKGSHMENHLDPFAGLDYRVLIS